MSVINNHHQINNANISVALESCSRQAGFQEVLHHFLDAQTNPTTARELYAQREGDPFDWMVMISGYSPYNGQFFACEQWVNFSDVVQKPGFGVRLYNRACIPQDIRPVHPQLMDGTHDEDYDEDVWSTIGWTQCPSIINWAGNILQATTPITGRGYFSEMLQRYDLVFDAENGRVVLQLAAGLGLASKPSEIVA